MIFRDQFNNTLKEGDALSVPVALGQSVLGTIAKLSSGLDPRNPQPVATVILTVNLGASPDGLIPGVVRVELQEQQSIVS
jgi:hypothetical protein